jgi:hypothetical protein
MNTLEYSKDPVDCCLEGSNCNSLNKGDCYELMAQRCARDWDSKCDVYLLRLDGSRDGNEFVKNVASKRYCRDKNSSCVTSCENGDCTLVGDDSYKNPVKLYDISKKFGSLKDDEISPLKASQCKQVCDVLNLSSFGDDDRVLNECLDRGSCGDVIMSLSENIVSNNIPYSNRRLKKFIDGYIAQDVTNIQTRVLVGGKNPQITTRPIDVPGPSVTLPVSQKDDLKLSPSSPSSFIKSREGFNSKEATGPSTTSIIIGLLFIAFVIGGGYKMYKKYKKY